MISRTLYYYFMILIIISSFPIVSALQIPPKVMAQTTSEAVRVLVDDVIQDLKYNDTTKAKAHLGILNEQLQNLGNSSSVQSAKVLLDDTNAALKKNNINGALVHLSLINQLSFANSTISGNIISSANTTKPLATTRIAKNKANHPPEAFGQTIVVGDEGSRNLYRIVDLRGNDIDGDPITFSITSNPTHGELKDFSSTTGLLTYNPQAGYAGNDSFSFQVTDNHNTRSNIAQVSVVVGNAALLQIITDTNNNLQVSLQAPDNWNSGTASANIHSLHNWRSYAVATANDDLSAFFVIINLPPLAKFGFLPFDVNLLSQYVTLNSQYNLNFNGYSGHAYSISVSSEQLSRLQSFLPPPISKEISAVIITTEQKGEIYLIVYGTDLGRMGEFQEIFQDILNSVSFHSSANVTTTPSVASSQITNVQPNHPPKAYDDDITVTSGFERSFKLTANDTDGDPVKFSIKSQPRWGSVSILNSDTGDVIYKTPDLCVGCTDKFSFQVTDDHNTTSNAADVSVHINAPSEGPTGAESSPSQPNTGGEDTTTPSESTPPPGVTNENPPSSGTDYSSICTKLQPVLIQPCSTLVSADGSLTSDGTHAMHCIRNGILLGGGAAALTHLPLSIILKGLSMLAAPTGCDGIVNMKAFDQLGDVGSLSSLTSLLP